MRKVVHALKRRLMPVLPAGLRSRFLRLYWESRWKKNDPGGPWLDRDVSAEIVEAAEVGWFEAGAPAIDLGCGRGDVAAWLAGRGFPSVGVDISPAAIDLATRTHREVPGRLEFVVADICAVPIHGRTFGVLVDRGCFHQLEARDRRAYALNLAIAAAPDARFLLFVKAFRDGVPAGDPDERDRRTREVEEFFSGSFSIDRIAETTLDRHATLHGLVFWLTRR